MDDLQHLKEEFEKLFGKPSALTYFCPGRVNLLGEHIDYNGGLVMPCAITLGTYLLVAPNNDGVIRFRSLNFPNKVDVAINSHLNRDTLMWFSSPMGVLHYLAADGNALQQGYDLLYYGNLPVGLSSSASIEMVTAFAFNELLEAGYEKLALVKMTMKVENDYIGVTSGLIDQFSVAFGESEKALVINCNTFTYQAVPLNLGEYCLAIINSNRPGNVAESKYNERVAQCRQALKYLQQQLPITVLCDIDTETLMEYKYLIKDEVLLKRARYVVEENDRVKAAALLLEQDNLKAFGELMYRSHLSLKELYEVSGIELDTIAEYSRFYKGVIGARMTGAGFGGCAIALVKEDSFDSYKADLTSYYTELIGYPPTVYRSAIGPGVGRLVNPVATI
ncbi:galactokinase [Mucilaginibacter sp.]|jgi:galactokinase|uniref:galactokinase n=1 Tax=Mucilaginibacter sp. TaxID=1882438 RepID=UPI00356B3165